MQKPSGVSKREPQGQHFALLAEMYRYLWNLTQPCPQTFAGSALTVGRQQSHEFQSPHPRPELKDAHPTCSAQNGWVSSPDWLLRIKRAATPED